MFKNIYYLLKVHFRIEIRERFSFYGIVIYLSSTIFLIYLSNQQINLSIWTSLFWVVQLFACVNAVTKNNTVQNNHKLLYYYNVCSPAEYIIANMILNAGFMIILSIINLILFTLFLNFSMTNVLGFTSVACLGGVSISLLFTFLSALAQKADQSASMVVILGFPIIVPLFILIIKLTILFQAPMLNDVYFQYVRILILLDMLVVALSLILFPYIWND